MTAIAPQHWLIAFIIAIAAHIVAGATIWAVDHAAPAPQHSPQGVMLSLDALTVGNNDAEAIQPQRVTPARTPVAPAESEPSPQPPEPSAATPSAAEPVPAQPVTPEATAPDTPDSPAAQSRTDGADIPVAPAVTVQSADTLAAIEQVPAVTAQPAQPPTQAEHGSGASGMSDDPTVTYIAHIRSWLGQHKYYPQAARENGAEGTVRLYVVIDRDGRVLNASVARSSGHTALDQAAMDMLKRAEPLPAMPDDLLRTRLAIILPVNFGLAPQPDAAVDD